ncbi:MAG TPA: HAMP domain-containing sensor histidine kinase, partial [Candidatus Saccharimonadales bacterium]|nr:HAMP domain-containing sensor histidine kinase [Candidatus Saccharimonadales bacterium]
RFAELGRLSTALFHDLANHLSTVSLDIEGLTTKDQSDMMRRISQNVGHIDTIVKRVRQQIRGESSIEVFKIMDEIDEVIKILKPMARQAGISVVVERDKSVGASLSYEGDVTRFRQIILNVLANGIEAYPPQPETNDARQVILRLKRQQTVLHIEAIDHGAGIGAEEQPKIFRPFYTTKEKGMGIGLFIVQQVVEKDFNGMISLVSDEHQGTTVSITLPKSYYAKTAGN